MASTSQHEVVSLFNDPTLSDVKIRQVCKGEAKEYFAHKAIMSAHSKWFRNAFTGSFKEASEKTIEVHDNDPQHFEYMLKFIYTMEIPFKPVILSKDHQETVDCEILTPIGLYVLADKYEIAPLLRRTEGQVETVMRTRGGILTGDTIPSIVGAYYSHCACAQSRMGVVIASGIDACAQAWLISGKLEDFIQLLSTYGHFVADLTVAMRVSGHLRR